MNSLFGVMGIVWNQVIADVINVFISYVIYNRVTLKLEPMTL